MKLGFFPEMLINKGILHETIIEYWSKCMNFNNYRNQELSYVKNIAVLTKRFIRPLLTIGLVRGVNGDTIEFDSMLIKTLYFIM